MALSQYLKMQIIQLLRSNNVNTIYYNDIKNLISSSKKNSGSIDDIGIYLTEQLVKEFAKSSKQVTNLEKYIQGLIEIVCGIGDDNRELNENTINEIKKIEEKYKKYRDENEEIITEILNDKMNYLLDTLYQKYPQDIKEIVLEEKSKKDSKLLEENLKQETLIKDYENEISELATNLKKSEKELKKVSLENKILEETKKKQSLTIEELKLKQKELQAHLQKQSQNLSETLKENIELQKSGTELYSKNLELLENCGKLETTNQKLLDALREIEERENKVDRELLIQELLIKSLYKGGITTLNYFQESLKQKDITLSYREIIQELNKLKTRINITSSNLPKVYKINSHPLDIYNKKCFLTTENYLKPLDLIFVSDLHINTIEELKNSIDIIYDYANKNRISYIVNLGDIFQINPPMYDLNIESLKKLEQNIDAFIKNIPQDLDIYHLLLGGNHDLGYFKFGLDPINTIADNHENCISLGYIYSELLLSNNASLSLSHPTATLRENDRLIKGIDPVNEEIITLINRNQTNIEDIYFNFIGHIHRSKLDLLNNYCQVPSLNKDRNKNGAWHVRIYFKSDKSIDCISFIPLINDNKLISTTEFVYTRKK